MRDRKWDIGEMLLVFFLDALGREELVIPHIKNPVDVDDFHDFL